MKVVILAQKFDTYSTRRLVSVLEERGHIVRLVSPLDCTLKVGQGAPEILHEGSSLLDADLVLLRCASYYGFGVLVVRAFETMLGQQLQEVVLTHSLSVLHPAVHSMRTRDSITLTYSFSERVGL